MTSRKRIAASSRIYGGVGIGSNSNFREGIADLGVVFIIRNLTENVNMNHNEEVPDFLGGLGDMLPADVLKKVNELLERVHRKDKDHQGSPVFIYAPGSQYLPTTPPKRKGSR